MRGPDPYTVADDPATPPQAIIQPGQRCTTPAGQELELMRDLGVRTWGNAAEGETVMLTGTYELDSEVSGRLLRALPGSLVLREDEWDCPVIPLLADEIVKDEPGQEAVLDRLLDLLLIAAPARLVRPPGGAARRAGTAPPATRWSAMRCGCCTTTRARRGRSPGWRARSACRAPRWPGASTSWSASRR